MLFTKPKKNLTWVLFRNKQLLQDQSFEPLSTLHVSTNSKDKKADPDNISPKTDQQYLKAHKQT
jgi:hypothetical protein